METPLTTKKELMDQLDEVCARMAEISDDCNLVDEYLPLIEKRRELYHAIVNLNSGNMVQIAPILITY